MDVHQESAQEVSGNNHPGPQETATSEKIIQSVKEILQAYGRTGEVKTATTDESLPDENDPRAILRSAINRIQACGRPDSPIEDVQTIFDFVSSYFHHCGPNTLLQLVVCHSLELDHRTYALYAEEPELVSRIEPVRRQLFASSRRMGHRPKSYGATHCEWSASSSNRVH